MDDARGDDNSAIFALIESLDMSGFEKAYSLFIVTECMGEYNSTCKAGSSFLDGLAFLGLFLLSWEDMRGKCRNVRVK